MLAKDIMQPNVYCVEESMTVHELYLDLLANEISGAPVLDANDYLVGVVSLSDVASCIAGDGKKFSGNYFSSMPVNATGSIKAEAIGRKHKVSDIMTPCIHKVSMDSGLGEVVDLMLDENIHRVVVAHRGHVVGIVTSGDIMRAFRDSLISV